MPKTKEALQAELEQLTEEAGRGTGLFYELYQQNLCEAVDHWLSGLKPEEAVLAQELLQGTDYTPPSESKGHWVYNPEENDIKFCGDNSVLED